MDKVTLIANDNQRSDYYRLKAPAHSLLKSIGQFFLQALLTPYYIYQIVVGRLLSYLAINPVFRKAEKEESLIVQNTKHADPLFNFADELCVIDVMPNRNPIMKILSNWYNFLTNKYELFKFLSRCIKKLASVFLTNEQYIDQYIDQLVAQVESHLQGKNEQKFLPYQIHFRGLDKLNAEQQATLYRKLHEKTGYDFAQNKNRVRFFKLQTTDNAVLDSVEISQKSHANEDIKNRRFIISCMPRSNNYIDWIKQYQVYAKNLDATIIAFNYRGIGLSKGIIRSQNNIYNDAYAETQRLLLEGARPENIALMGECVGGNVATHTAGTLHQQGIPVKLYNARSFRSLTAIIEEKAKPEKNASLANPLTWLHWIKYAFVKLFVFVFVKSANWELNVDKQFLAIPPHDRDFLVVRSKKDSQGQHFADDEMVPHDGASIYSLVKEQTNEIQTKKRTSVKLTATEQEWIKDKPKAHKFHVSSLHKDPEKANGHTVPPQLLTPSHPDLIKGKAKPDGREYAMRFFERVWPSCRVNHQQSSACNLTN